MLVLWGAGAWFILKDQFDTTSFRVSPGQVTGTATAIVLLVLLALTRRPNPAPRTGQVPAPWVVAVVLGRWSRSPAWEGRHVVGAVVGDLIAIGGPAFVTTPLGDIPVWQKLASNVVLLTLVLAVAALAYAAERRASDGRFICGSEPR